MSTHTDLYLHDPASPTEIMANICWMLCVGFVFSLLTYSVESSHANAKSDYELLINSYSNSGKSLTTLIPLTDQTAAMTVSVTVYLYSINNFDEVSGHVEIDCSLKLEWTDQTAVNYGNTGDLLVSPDKVWKPDIVLINAIDTVKSIGDSAYKVRINRASRATEWHPRVIVKASCTPDVTYFPFDRQTCSFTYTPWGYTTSEIDLTLPQSQWDQSSFTPSGVWTVISSSSEEYAQNNAPYMRFTLTIEREPLFFMFNILLPVLLLGLLNGFVFLMPAESGERVGFCITCFLSFVFLLHLTMELLPRASEPMSLFCYYLVIMMAFSMSISIVTIIMLRVYNTPEKDKVPDLIQSTVRAIKCLWVKPCCNRMVNYCKSNVKGKAQEVSNKPDKSSEDDTLHVQDLELSNDPMNEKSKQSDITSKPAPKTSEKKEAKVQGKENEQGPNSTRDADKDEADEKGSDPPEVPWTEVGQVLDFFFFLLFLGTQGAFTVIFIIPLGTRY